MLPEIAFNLSRGCGNPTGFSNLQRGDVVADFGCGGGTDVILAANRVGSEGRVIGIDFTDQMIGRAKQAAVEMGLQERDIHFHVADLEKSQLPGGCADVVVSNCVINLYADKVAVYQEAFRILKPGGQAAISDIVITEHIASDLRAKFQSAWSGCWEALSPNVTTGRRSGTQALAKAREWRATLWPRKNCRRWPVVPGKTSALPPARVI